LSNHVFFYHYLTRKDIFFITAAFIRFGLSLIILNFDEHIFKPIRYSTTLYIVSLDDVTISTKKLKHKKASTQSKFISQYRLTNLLDIV